MNRTSYLLPAIVICFLCLVHGQGTLSAQEEIPRPAHLVLNRISKLVNDKQYNQAIIELEQFQNRSPEKSRHSKKTGNHHYLITFALGNCYLYTDQPEQAAEKYRVVTLNNPRYLPAWSNLGKTYLQLQQHEKAAESFEQAYELSDRLESRFLYLVAVSYLNGGKPESALEKMLSLKQRHPQEFSLTRQETLVQVLFALKRFPEALPIIKNIIHTVQGPRKKTWQEILLYQYLALEMHPAATALAEELARQYPLEPKWWKGLAHLYLTAHRLDETLVSMTVYDRLKPLSTEEKKMMATLNLSLNLPLQASRIYEELAQQKFEPQVVKNLVQCHLKLGDADAALKLIDTGLQHFEDTDLLLLKANLLFEKQQYAKASAAYEKLTTSDPNQGQAWLMWGYSAWKLGKEATARKALAQASTFKKQKTSALNILRQLDR